jgi:hypothetical protein
MQARLQRSQTHFRPDQMSAVRKEMVRYESFSLADKNVNILHWWRDHEKVLPHLAKVAKKVLTVPASSAKSERVFSTGGNFVTKKRSSLAPKKVEELILIKENKSKIEAFKEKGTYKLIRTHTDAFNTISVDEVLAEMLTEEERAEEEEDDDNEEEYSDEEDDDIEEEAEILYYLDDDDDEDTSEDED